jgi:hypothetical protein
MTSFLDFYMDNVVRVSSPTCIGRCDEEQSGFEPNAETAVSVSQLVDVVPWLIGVHQGSGLCVPSQFDLQAAILQAMARQAKRSMRSLSESSCSSLSSLSTSESACSVSSSNCLQSSADGHANDSEWEGKARGPAEPFFQAASLEVTASCSLGKRRRRRNPENEGAHQKKRQKTNPRNRRRSKKERVTKSKRGQAIRAAVESEKLFTDLYRSLKVKEGPVVYDIETVKSKDVTVVRWDGV